MINANEAFELARNVAVSSLRDDTISVYAAITEAAKEGRISVVLDLPALCLPMTEYRINGLVKTLEDEGYQCEAKLDTLNNPQLVVRWGDSPQSVRSLLSQT